MHLPELCDVWVGDLSCFVVVGWVADFFLEYFPAVAVAQVFHECLADFDILVDTLVGIDGAASRPREQHGLDKWGIGDGGVSGALGGEEPCKLLALQYALDKILDDVEMRSAVEDRVL